jgi:hypothetical protein
MKIIKLLPLILLLFTTISCQTTDPEDIQYDELTPSEYKQLVKKTRIFIAIAPVMRLNPISSNDKRFINTHEPTRFFARYYEDKGGEFKMIWEINPSYSVRVIGKGKFLDPSCKFRLTVSRFAQ